MVALRREDWTGSTSARWRRLVEPIVDGLAGALQRGITIPEDPQFTDLSSMFAPMMRTSASLIYYDWLDKVLTSVAGSTLIGSEVRTSLVRDSVVTVLPVSIAEFTRDLDLPDGNVILYLLLHEASRQWLFYGIRWLPPQLDALLAHYAHEIRIDFEALSLWLDIGGEEVPPGDIVAIGEKVHGPLFKSASTELQLEVLGRLEALLALIEG